MKKLLLITMVVLIGTPCFAKDEGETAMAFVKIGQEARVAGMGEAFVGLADDVSALYWNPAGLSQLEEREASFMYLKPFTDVSGLGYGYLSSAFPTNEGVWALSLSYFDYGSEEKYDNLANSHGTWEASDICLSFGFGRKVNENVAFGFSLKAIEEDIDTEDAPGLAVDCGVLYKPDIENMKIGAAIKNIGPKVKFRTDSDSLPLSLKLGLSYLLPNAPVTLVLDSTIPNDNKSYIGIGGEYNYKEALAIRLGYKGGPQDEGSGLTAGFGIKHPKLNFDFAYQPASDLGNSYVVSVRGRIE
ncbi:MAG: PorV/PorQ family protein [bacterium]